MLMSPPIGSCCSLKKKDHSQPLWSRLTSVKGQGGTQDYSEPLWSDFTRVKGQGGTLLYEPCGDL